MLCLASLSGCQHEPPKATPSAVPSASASPKASATAVVSEPNKAFFQELQSQFEAPVESDKNGYPRIKKLLAGQIEPMSVERLGALDLDAPRDLADFDAVILPVLERGFASPVFLDPNPKIAKNSEIDYRGVRRTVTLLLTRAQIFFKADQLGRATDLAVLPLSLGKGMQVRPETVSSNLFSLSYQAASLQFVLEALGGPVEASMLDLWSSELRANRPQYEQVRRSVSVDFVRLKRTIDDPALRAEIGYETVSEERLAKWGGELDQLHDFAKGLYSPGPIQPEVFNEHVLGASQELQGLIIDYPQVASMQKQAWAKYLATEIAVVLKADPKLGWNGALEKVTAGDPGSRTAIEGLIFLDTQPDKIRIVGLPGVFELLVPNGELVFYTQML